MSRRHPRYTRRPQAAFVLVAGAVVLGACTGTTYDPSAERSTTPAVASTTTTLPTGTTAELLDRLAAETAELEHVIQAKGDVATSISRINALWTAAQIGVTDPAMHSGFDGAIRQAQRAAAGHQMGFAAKAGKSVAALVTAFHAGSTAASATTDTATVTTAP